MADHDELLSEMETIERLPTQERLKHAKRRRALQLKQWSDAEKDALSRQDANSRKINIRFPDHVMLLEAVMRKDYDEVKRLLELGVDANLSNEDGLTSIHQCCIDDSPEILKLLVKYGANVNVCDNDLWTPLHAAATCANLEICKILIQNNAELLAVNTDGNMPYDICDDEVCLEYIESEMANRGVTQQTIDIKRAEIEIRMLEDVKLLNFMSQDLSKKMPNVNGATFMHIACANGYTSVLEFLLEHKASFNVQDNDGWTPLHVATFWGHQKAIEILIEYGADIYAKTFNEETVFDLSDDIDVREFIVQKKKEVDNNEVTTKTRSLKRSSTGVSRSSSVRRSSFRDKEKAEKARKLDTSFKDVLFASESKRDELEAEEFQDKSNDIINTTDEELDSLDQLNSSELIISNYLIPQTTNKQITKLAYINDNNNNANTTNNNPLNLIQSSDDLVNRKAYPLKSASSSSSSTSNTTINNNNNNNNMVNDNTSSNTPRKDETVIIAAAPSPILSSINKTRAPKMADIINHENRLSIQTLQNDITSTPTTVATTPISNNKYQHRIHPEIMNGYDTHGSVNSTKPMLTNQNQAQQHQQQQQQPVGKNQVNFSNIQETPPQQQLQSQQKTGYMPVDYSDGVKYKFISNETIGGKSDLTSFNRFKCSNCYSCTVL